MKLRTRFILGFLAIGLVACALGFFSLRTYSTVREEFTLLKEDVVPGAVSILETEVALNALLTEVEEIVIVGDATHREHALTDANRIKESIAEHLAIAEKAGGEEYRDMLEVENQLEQIINSANQVMDAVDAGESGTTLINSIDELHTAAETLVAYLDTDVAEHMAELLAAEENVSDAHQVGILASWAAIAIALVASVGVGLYTARSVLQPISLLGAAAHRIRSGDLDVVVDVENKDETAVLAEAFNQMVARLRDMIMTEQEQREHLQQANTEIEKRAQAEQEQREHLQNTVQQYVEFMAEVARGNLAARVQTDGNGSGPDDPLTILGHNLNQTTASLQTMTLQIRDAANNLSAATAEILAATTQQASGASEQSAAISQASTTIDEVRTISEQTSQRAKGVTNVAQRTVEISHSGQQAVAETIQGMEQVKEKVESISRGILDLSDQTQAIGQIIATVNAIANQSNILALNAAVEAARAGEAGKGFAVVADEVRSLAEQSQAATAQVEEILSEIQRGVNAAVMATEQGTKMADTGVRLAGEAGLSIQQLAKSVTESTQSATQISAAAVQQVTGMEQIASAMQNIDQATVQSLASTRQAEKAAQDLTALAQQLADMVGQYQL
jgi:methyl-accepting chemotaxis protein